MSPEDQDNIFTKFKDYEKTWACETQVFLTHCQQETDLGGLIMVYKGQHSRWPWKYSLQKSNGIFQLFFLCTYKCVLWLVFPVRLLPYHFLCVHKHVLSVLDVQWIKSRLILSSLKPDEMSHDFLQLHICLWISSETGDTNPVLFLVYLANRYLIMYMLLVHGGLNTPCINLE